RDRRWILGMKGQSGRTRAEPVYDFDQIARCHETILRQERTWDAFFAEGGVQPHRVVYEALAGRLEETARDILRHLHVEGHERAVAWALKRKQADSVNAVWTRQF